MPRWNEEQLQDFLRRNTAAGNPVPNRVPASKPEPALRDEPLATAPRKEGSKPRLRVVVTSRRTRLVDPDNCCPKYVIDLLRYGGVLPDDSPEFIDLEIRQERVKKKDQEETIIDIT